MYYLKCNNCGHLNEVKSEYLTFCSDCDKKLDNNYTAWKKRNDTKTLDDFKLLMCVSASDFQDVPDKPKMKIKGLKYWVGFPVMFAILYAVGQFGGEAVVRFVKSEIIAREVIQQEWHKETYGNLGLKVETPVKMTKGDLPIPENVRSLIAQMDTYNYTSLKGFTIIISSFKYDSKVGETNLIGAANGSINEMRMQKGVVDFTYSEDFIEKNGIKGFVQQGSFKENGIKAEFINSGFSQGLMLWQVMVAHPAGDLTNQVMAQRIIDSIEIDVKAL